ncbi:hypothetical protein [Flavobacterium sp. B17]|nr:hypothetical protein [Flavobacterium sp. B17]
MKTTDLLMKSPKYHLYFKNNNALSEIYEAMERIYMTLDKV